jgi:hypothetical protein
MQGLPTLKRDDPISIRNSTQCTFNIDKNNGRRPIKVSIKRKCASIENLEAFTSLMCRLIDELYNVNTF